MIEKDRNQEFSEQNVERLREIERVIGSTVIFSSDNKVLMGRKDPESGGVYADAWHLPGGGANPGESAIQAAVRETNEEIYGLDLTESDLLPLPSGDRGETVKVVNGERVWCKMVFNRFEVHLPKPASAYAHLRPDSDFVEIAWFDEKEQSEIKQAAGRKDVFKKAHN